MTQPVVVYALALGLGFGCGSSASGWLKLSSSPAVSCAALAQWMRQAFSVPPSVRVALPLLDHGQDLGVDLRDAHHGPVALIGDEQPVPQSRTPLLHGDGHRRHRRVVADVAVPHRPLARVAQVLIAKPGADIGPAQDEQQFSRIHVSLVFLFMLSTGEPAARIPAVIVFIMFCSHSRGAGRLSSANHHGSTHSRSSVTYVANTLCSHNT